MGKDQEAGGARRFCEFLKDKGLLCKETHQHVIRLAPPLVIRKQEIDQALEYICSALETI
jgi:ornithine--oxo-acid transaminase